MPPCAVSGGYERVRVQRVAGRTDTSPIRTDSARIHAIAAEAALKMNELVCNEPRFRRNNRDSRATSCEFMPPHRVRRRHEQ